METKITEPFGFDIHLGIFQSSSAAGESHHCVSRVQYYVGLSGSQPPKPQHYLSPELVTMNTAVFNTVTHSRLYSCKYVLNILPAQNTVPPLSSSNSTLNTQLPQAEILLTKKESTRQIGYNHSWYVMLFILRLKSSYMFQLKRQF